MGRRSQDNQIDWELVEKEFRLGQSTLRQLAAAHKVQPSAISRKANKEQWVQDKKAAVKARSEAQLLLSNNHKATDKATPTEGDIEIAATVRTNIVLEHRNGLAKLKSVQDKLLVCVESVVDNLGNLAEVVEILRKPDKSGRDKANDAMRKAMERSTVIDDVKKLAEIDEKVRKGEREAFSLGTDEQSDTANAMQAWIKAMGKSSLPIVAEPAE